MDEPAGSTQEIIARLTALGLDEDEATVYVQLAAMGPSKVSDVAHRARMSRPRTYRVLDALMQRGFASALFGRPLRYQGAPPDAVFQELRRRAEAAVQDVVRAQEEVGSALAALRQAPEPEPARDAFIVIEGRREALRRAERMVRGAEREVRALTTHPAAGTERRGLLDLVLRRPNTAVAARILVRPQARRAAEGSPNNTEVRFLDSERPARLLIVDDRELLVAVVAGGADAKEVHVWSDATDFVHGQRMLFDAAWTRGAGEGRSDVGPDSMPYRGPTANAPVAGEAMR